VVQKCRQGKCKAGQVQGRAMQVQAIQDNAKGAAKRHLFYLAWGSGDAGMRDDGESMSQCRNNDRIVKL
jgi:hypothetical protein